MAAHILLIEDEPILRAVLTKRLEMLGFTVSAAEHGRKALALFAEKTADLVVTDILMPEVDGFQTIIQLRQREPKLPILAMTGGGELDPDFYLRIARGLGSTQLLRKPFLFEDLYNVIQTLLARVGAQQA
jgi:CheY-like chemotaxis protein